MIVTTTDGVEDKRIVEYLGVVSGEAVFGANVFRDFFASVRDIVGGRAGGYERVLKDGKETAIGDMVEEAKALGANAVIAVGVGNIVKPLAQRDAAIHESLDDLKMRIGLPGTVNDQQVS